MMILNKIFNADYTQLYMFTYVGLGKMTSSALYHMNVIVNMSHVHLCCFVLYVMSFSVLLQYCSREMVVMIIMLKNIMLVTYCDMYSPARICVPVKSCDNCITQTRKQNHGETY